MIMRVADGGRIRRTAREILQRQEWHYIRSRRRQQFRLIVADERFQVPAQAANIPSFHRLIAGKLVLQRVVEVLHVRGLVVELDSSNIESAAGCYETRLKSDRRKSGRQRGDLSVGIEHRRQ